jgi:acyl-CoA reductase-like NAD-dependent aldehyde dehydrogenase
MKIINPATEELIAEIAEDTFETLKNKFQILKTAQKEWPEKNLKERVDIILKFNQLLTENIEELANTLSLEVGKPLQQSRNEVNGAANKSNWLAKNAETYLKNETMYLDNAMKEEIRYEPLGVIANISAWNYPYNVGVNIFIPALLAGNAVMYKPSEYSSLTGLLIEKYLKLAGIPEGVFQVAIGDGKVGEHLLNLDFDSYNFTGSHKTGQYIYEKIASKMKPCILELGGKDPVYVSNDLIDIKSVAAGIADGAFYNNGQSCCSVERIYVHKEVYEPFVAHFVEEVKSWKIGNPFEENVYISVLTRKEQLNILEAQVKDALAKGANCVIGGNRLPKKGNYFEPTVFLEVNHSMDLMQEESFGPIIGIMKVDSDEQAIELMNDTNYGLTAAVYSNSKERAESILNKINAGSGYWNCCDRVSAALPWSGRKNSGFGSSLSGVGIRAFTKPKGLHLRNI